MGSVPGVRGDPGDFPVLPPGVPAGGVTTQGEWRQHQGSKQRLLSPPPPAPDSVRGRTGDSGQRTLLRFTGFWGADAQHRGSCCREPRAQVTRDEEAFHEGNLGDTVGTPRTPS